MFKVSCDVCEKDVFVFDTMSDYLDWLENQPPGCLTEDAEGKKHLVDLKDDGYQVLCEHHYRQKSILYNRYERFAVKFGLNMIKAGTKLVKPERFTGDDDGN